MCSPGEDFHRTVSLLFGLAAYANKPNADQTFIKVIGPALAVSLPAPPPGTLPPGYDPNAGPEHPGQEG